LIGNDKPSRFNKISGVKCVLLNVKCWKIAQWPVIDSDRQYSSIYNQNIIENLY
jgi:hypothetical protein